MTRTPLHHASIALVASALPALVTGCHGARALPASTTQTTSAIVAPSAPLRAAPESSEPPHDGERVVARLRPRFRLCYERALREENPSMSGVAVLHVRIATDGTVRDVEVSKRVGLSSNVASCVAREARAAQFEPPGEGGAALEVPVHFVRSAPPRSSVSAIR